MARKKRNRLSAGGLERSRRQVPEWGGRLGSIRDMAIRGMVRGEKKRGGLKESNWGSIIKETNWEE